MPLSNGAMRYWREVLLVVLVTLPWLSLLVLGIAWLWQGGYVWIWALAAGSIGLLSWPLWYSVKRRSKQEARIALPAALAAVTSRPAAILGIEAGEIAAGKNADVCIFDPAALVKITPESLRSQGKNTPFIGYELPGRVRYTLVGGNVVFEG